MGKHELSEVIGSIVLIPGETIYLVGRVGDVPPKTYNQKALVSKFAEYFKDGNFKSIQVLRFNDPFFEELSEEELRKIYKIQTLKEMYEAHILREMYESCIKDLEEKVL